MSEIQIFLIFLIILYAVFLFLFVYQNFRMIRIGDSMIEDFKELSNIMGRISRMEEELRR